MRGQGPSLTSLWRLLAWSPTLCICSPINCWVLISQAVSSSTTPSPAPCVSLLNPLFHLHHAARALITLTWPLGPLFNIGACSWIALFMAVAKILYPVYVGLHIEGHALHGVDSLWIENKSLHQATAWEIANSLPIFSIRSISQNEVWFWC